MQASAITVERESGSGLSAGYWYHIVGEEFPAPHDAIDKGLDIDGQTLLAAVLAYVRKTGNCEFPFLLWNALEQLPDFEAYRIQQDELLCAELDRRRLPHCLDSGCDGSGPLGLQGGDVVGVVVSHDYPQAASKDEVFQVVPPSNGKAQDGGSESQIAPGSRLPSVFSCSLHARGNNDPHDAGQQNARDDGPKHRQSLVGERLEQIGGQGGGGHGDSSIDAKRVSLQQPPRDLFTVIYDCRGAILFALGLAIGVVLSISMVESEINSFFSGEEGVEACRALLSRVQ